jgi:sec-independent protein translocase protein TatA
MQTMTDNGLMVALSNLRGGEIILILAIVLILFGAKKLPELARGLGQGLTAFRDATKDVLQTVDDEASEAGRSVGGIYGKPAAQALTPDNQVAELYKPAVFEDKPKSRQSRPNLARLLETLWHRILSFLGLGHGTNQTRTPGK